MGGGFNYNGEGATGTGLDRDPYVRDSNGNAIGIKSGYHAESYGTSSPALGPNGGQFGYRKILYVKRII